MAIRATTVQQHPGGNHSAVITQSVGAGANDGALVLGKAVWDPARAQFAFLPDNQDLVLSAADQASIVAALNSMSR